MVKQAEQAKNSSTKSGSTHRFPSSIVCGYQLPLTIEMTYPSDIDLDLVKSGSEDAPSGFVLSGTSDERRFGPGETWREPPHLAFANLLVEDLKAVAAFVKRYGVLQDTFFDKDPEEEEAKAYLRKHGITPFKSPTPKNFRIDSRLLEDLQEQLRGAWVNEWSFHKAYVSLLHDQIEEGTTVNIRPPGVVVLATVDPWTFICFLFLRDLMAGRLGFCGNPDCAAPYFRKKRKTQKYCEQGPCVQYAQRKYSLSWWDRKGKKKREEKMKNQSKGKNP